MFNRIAVFVLAAFFLTAATILLATGLALLVPGTFLDAIWHLYEYRRAQLMPYGFVIGPVFLLLALLAWATAIGCWRRRRWGIWLAIGIFVDNAIGYIVQLFSGHWIEGGIGLVVSGLLVFGLLELSVRAKFR
ncbi:MAG TPA: hypothetical protein VH000_12040 [Rhizomicrobium sp.]|jgi:hypothetical protein|nr:hypothetical protein [Rhizomicrobium sp.]